MPKIVFNYILSFIALVLAQSIVFNNLILFNSAVALVFVYFIITLPITLSTNIVVSLSFVLGLSVDVFQDTPGLNAMTCTVAGFIRRPIFHLYVPRDEDFAGRRLGIATIGTAAFLKYMLTLVLLYCTLYFSIESLNFAALGQLCLRISASTLYTFIIIYAVESITLTKREKRL